MKRNSIVNKAKLTALIPVIMATAIGGSMLHAGSKSDRDAKVEKTIIPSFPRELLEKGVDAGKAKVLVHVDAEGKLIDALCTEALYPEVGEAVVRAVKQWRFTPPTRDGKPVSFIKELELDLTTGWGIKNISTMDFVFKERGPGVNEPRYHAVSLKELDRIPKPLAMKQPGYPMDLREAGIKGRVLVDFYIDETGAVRFPEVRESPSPDLSAIAIETISQWKFEPPLLGGKPALVKAVQKFDFTPPPAPSAETAGTEKGGKK